MKKSKYNIIQVFLLCLCFSYIHNRNLQESTPENITPAPTSQKWIDKNKELIMTISIAVPTLLVIISILVSFYQIPLHRGFKCRCGERTKWFLKAFFYQIFGVFVLFYYLLKFFEKILDCIWPDTKEEDNKLKEDISQPKEENDQKKKKFFEMNDDTKEANK